MLSVSLKASFGKAGTLESSLVSDVGVVAHLAK